MSLISSNPGRPYVWSAAGAYGPNRHFRDASLRAEVSPLSGPLSSAAVHDSVLVHPGYKFRAPGLLHEGDLIQIRSR